MNTYIIRVIRHYPDRHPNKYNTYFRSSKLSECYVKLKEELSNIFGDSLFEHFSNEKFLEFIELGEVSFGDISLDIQELSVINLDE
jgi:hypothetical protein